MFEGRSASAEGGDGGMAGLKVLRNVVGLAWIGVFIWGIVSLFRGDWAGVGIAAALWVVFGIIFGVVHSALQRAEVRAASVHMSDIALAVSLGDWASALDSSSRSVKIMESSFTRDRGQKEMAGPFAITLVGHAILLGAVGRRGDANDTLDRAVPTLRGLRAAAPEIAPLLDIAEGLRNSYPSTLEFQAAAHAFHSFA